MSAQFGASVRFGVGRREQKSLRIHFEKRRHDRLGPRPQKDRSVASEMLCFVGARRIEPHCTTSIDVARAHDHDFAGPRSGEELKLNQRGDLFVDAQENFVDVLLLHWADGFGFLC